MNRRRFLNFAGQIVPLTLLLLETSACVGTSKDQERSLPLQGQSLLDFLRMASSAPNPHNTQAWLIRIQGDNSFTLYLDQGRILPATDPTHRQMHIGLGCFLESFRLAAGRQGYSSQIAYLESPTPTSALDGWPIARVSITHSNEKADPLAACMEKRRTNRGPYVNALPDQASTWIKDAQVFGQIRLLEPSLHTEIRQIAKEAMRIETMTQKTHSETLKWFRFTEQEVNHHQDGLSIFTGMSGMKAWIVSHFFVTADSWFSAGTVKQSLDYFNEAVDQTPAFVAFVSNENSPRDWLEIGRSYLRFQLAAASEGFAVHPLSQALQEYSEMIDVQKKLNGVLQIAAPAKVQMLIRLGRPQSTAGRYSPRREVQDYLMPA